MLTVAVVNEKGGVGKTTAAANLAQSLALQGLRVLVVDADPQGSVSRLLDAEPRRERPLGLGAERDLTVSDALEATQHTENGPAAVGAFGEISVPAGQHWHELVTVAPANTDLAKRTDAAPWALQRWRLAVQGVPADVVLIDCAPTLGPLLLGALHAADVALIVTEPALSGVEAVPRGADTIEAVRQARGGQAPHLLGVLVSNAPSTEAYPAEMLQRLRDSWPVLGVVPRRSVVRKAEGAGAPVAAYGREGQDVATVYEQLAEQVAQHARTHEQEESRTHG